jgi:uncharacterized membrane protein
MAYLKRTWTEEQMETAVGRVLRLGVLIAAAMVLVGGILYLIRYGGGIPDYRVFRGEPEDLKSLSGIVNGVLSFRRRHLIQFGLIVLIATPVARVVLALIAFALKKDLTYVAVSLIVLAMLLFGLLGGVL